MRNPDRDRRPSIEHDRSTPDNFDAFLFVPGTYEHQDKPSRIRVLCGEKTLGAIEISDELTTSESASAEVMGTYDEVTLTEEQARWLHRTLGRLIERIDAEASK